MNKIALLNDQLRLTMATSSRGRVVMTAGVAALPEEDVARVLDRVRRFDEFTPENDPHGEHDFGSFDVAGTTYFFKVDYYSPDMEGGSEDPADPDKTTRVLTIMRADEYLPPSWGSFLFRDGAVRQISAWARPVMTRTSREVEPPLHGGRYCLCRALQGRIVTKHKHNDGSEDSAD